MFATAFAMPAATPAPLFSHRHRVIAILCLGVLASVVSYWLGHASEEAEAEAEFTYRATLRHAFTRAILGRYEDALFSLSALFLSEAPVSRPDFVRVANKLGERISGVQAFEWVPVIPQAERATFEAFMQPAYPRYRFQIVEFDAAGQPKRAPERGSYYPIAYIEPLKGNDVALGYDLASGPTRDVLERARETRQVLATPQVRLAQETQNTQGVVMILPVYRSQRLAGIPVGAATPTDRFVGFVQGVFRVGDLLEATQSQQPPAGMDMLVIDAAEADPARRVLFFRPADKRGSPITMTEVEFRQGVVREFKLPFGQRDWRVLLRPQKGWMEMQFSSMPLLRSMGMLLLGALVASIVQLVSRRTQTIRDEVAVRTEELTESRRQLANMLRALPGMAYRCTYDDQLTVLFVSEGARELTGWSAEEFMAGSIHLRELLHPDDVLRVRDATKVALGQRSDVEVEYRIRTKSGGEKWVLSRGRGVYTTDGKLEVFEGLAIDVTAQKEAETVRLTLERKLLEGQKLESLGLLAGGVAHDFNNLLSAILGNATMARLSLTAGHEAEEQMRAIESAALRAAELCRQMLAYAGKGRFVIETVDLTTLIEDLQPLLKVSIVHQASLEMKLARNLPPVVVDAAQIRQIMMNLVLNAAEAMSDRNGVITITTGQMHADLAMLSGCVAGAELPTGDYVFLEVRDTGIGMSAEVLAKIFDPFFSTKFAGRGLGLAAVLGIVRGHHGALRVESTPGLGSTFRLLLPPAPATELTPALGLKPTTSTKRWQRTGHVLVIEDEEPVRFVTMEMLRMFGFTPYGAADGASGLERFREDPAKFDLVMLDLLMPGMSGEDVFRELRAIRPDLRVLLISGYNEGDILRRLGGGPALNFLAKPYTRDAFEQTLRSLLD